MKNTLADERKKSKVNPVELTNFIYEKEVYNDMLKEISSRPIEKFDYNIYGLGRA